MGKKDTTCKLVAADYGLICSWLENPPNRHKLDWMNIQKKTKLGARIKARAYEELAQYLNRNQHKGSTLVVLERHSMKTRYRHYFKLYRAAKVQSSIAGWGLTDDDIAVGILTVEAKLEQMCACFTRMDAIFGEGPNVTTFPSNQNIVGDVEGESTLDKAALNSANDKNKQAARVIDHSTGDRDGIKETLEDEGNDNRFAAEAADKELNLDEASPTEFVDLSRAGSPLPTPARTHSVPQSGPRVTQESTPMQGIANLGGHVHRRGNLSSYPSKKKISEICHSINSAVVVNLEANSQLKEKVCEFKVARLEFDQHVEDRKLAWEKERLALEREDRRLALEAASRIEAKNKEDQRLALEAALRRVAEDRELQMLALKTKNVKLAAYLSCRSPEEIKELLKLPPEQTDLKLAALTSARPHEEVKEILKLLDRVA